MCRAVRHDARKFFASGASAQAVLQRIFVSFTQELHSSLTKLDFFPSQELSENLAMQTKKIKKIKENLALLIARAREGRKLVQALARSALQIREYRERWYRYLSSGAGQSLAMKLETSLVI